MSHLGKCLFACYLPGADPNKYDNLSPLHVAACKGYSEVVDVLVTSKADVDAQDM